MRSPLPDADPSSRLPGFRIAARVLPFDGDDRLLMMRRVKEDAEYVVSIGGGVERGESVTEAAHRECFEEAGARVTLQALVLTVVDERPRKALTYVYAATLDGCEPEKRTGGEFTQPGRGLYELIFLCQGDPRIALVEPPELQRMLTEQWAGVREIAGARPGGV